MMTKHRAVGVRLRLTKMLISAVPLVVRVPRPRNLKMICPTTRRPLRPVLLLPHLRVVRHRSLKKMVSLNPLNADDRLRKLKPLRLVALPR